MTVPLWLHAAAWWAAVGVLGCAVVWVIRKAGREVWIAALIYWTVLALLAFVLGCPPAHSATLHWTAPLYEEGYSARGQRCLAGNVPERVALCLVTRQPVGGIARCVAKLPCVRGQRMAWAVPDSLRGAWFDVVAADSAGNHSCAGNAVWVP